MKRQLTEKMMKMFQLNYLVATEVDKADLPTRYKSVLWLITGYIDFRLQIASCDGNISLSSVI